MRDPDPFSHRPDDALIAAITFSEIAAGFELADTPERRANRGRFLAEVTRRFPVLPFGEAEAPAYARCYAVLRRTGLLPGLADLQIAATAIAGGHSVMTGNRAELERIPVVTLYDPPQR
jgi:predicted nucleic acid-binding protein